jgi:hypothetical protein
MKKRTCVMMLLLAAAASAAWAAPSEGGLLSYKLTGSWAGISGGDYNDRILGENGYLKANSTSMSGAYEELKRGLGFQVEVILPLSRRLGVGFGGGYYRIRSEGTVSYSGVFDGAAFEVESTLIPRISVLPFFVNLHCQFELGSKLQLDAYAGPLFQIVQFNAEIPSTSTILSTVETITFTATKTSLGAQAGLGLAYRILKSISIVADAFYRTGSVSNLTGNWTQVGTNDDGEIAGSSDSYYLWGFDTTASGTFSRAGFYDKDGPTDAGISNIKKAEISLNGLTFQAGLRINF